MCAYLKLTKLQAKKVVETYFLASGLERIEDYKEKIFTPTDEIPMETVVGEHLKKAEKDITCYQLAVFDRSRNFPCSSFFDKEEIISGELNTKVMDKIEGYAVGYTEENGETYYDDNAPGTEITAMTISVGKGVFHLIKDKKDAEALFNRYTVEGLAIFEVIIPSGSVYFEEIVPITAGIDYDCYAAKEVIYKKCIKKASRKK